MIEDRGGSSALKGRLADVFVPALVDGALDALSRRLGNRATIDDPLYGRASTLSSIDPILAKTAARFEEAQATYRHVASTTGIDRDVSEGVLTMTTGSGKADLPIAVVAERRRLREIELRVYYATGTGQRTAPAPIQSGEDLPPLPQIVAHVVEAMRRGAVERVLAAFEEGSRWIDPHGGVHAKRDGAMSSLISDLGGRLDLVPTGAADDGRTCCIEVVVARQRLQAPQPATLSFERGDSGLLRELRAYWEP